jgi:3-keto-5-aminohexanoate cleavage enzyme
MLLKSNRRAIVGIGSLEMCMTPQTWIEVALNGPWGRERQPGIPITPEEIISEGIAAAKAGASIIHLHAYDPSTGRQDDDAETYAGIFEGIRAQTDALVYPTIPLAGSSLSGSAETATERFRHVEFLAERGLIDMTVVDPGSANFSRLDLPMGSEPGFIYLNPEDHILRGLEIAATHSLTPSYAIYEPGFTRMGAALASRFPGLRPPIYRFMFSDAFAWGFPPRHFALEAHLALLRETAPDVPWMVAGLGVDLRHLIPEVVASGGHVRVGLEDAPFGCEQTNAALVEEAARLIRAAGGEPAAATGVRQALAASTVTASAS